MPVELQAKMTTNTGLPAVGLLARQAASGSIQTAVQRGQQQQAQQRQHAEGNGWLPNAQHCQQLLLAGRLQHAT